jgi:hypothetical protein
MAGKEGLKHMEPFEKTTQANPVWDFHKGKSDGSQNVSSVIPAKTGIHFFRLSWGSGFPPARE